MRRDDSTGPRLGKLGVHVVVCYVFCATGNLYFNAYARFNKTLIAKRLSIANRMCSFNTIYLANTCSNCFGWEIKGGGYIELFTVKHTFCRGIVNGDYGRRYGINM